MQPIAGEDRYLLIDVVRAVALLGVFFVNAETLFRVSLFAHIAHTEVASTDALDRITNSFLVNCVEFKAYTLFAFLFGVLLLFSRAWLMHYRFGPVEWLWRSLTYGRRQRLVI